MCRRRILSVEFHRDSFWCVCMYVCVCYTGHGECAEDEFSLSSSTVIVSGAYVCVRAYVYVYYTGHGECAEEDKEFFVSS
jgi:hypothetical protein